MCSDCPRLESNDGIRLAAYLARCGVASRRACEEIIRAGRVTLNAQPVRHPAVRVRPESDQVAVDGTLVRPQPALYLALHKPRGLLCTSHDPQGRRTFWECLPTLRRWRLYSVGRLDADSEGLLLVTNDGGLAARLIHPRYHVPKVYRVWCAPPVKPEWLARFIRGVESEGEVLRARSVRTLEVRQDLACYEVVLVEGRKRQIRRMFAKAGAEVRRLLRTQIGPVRLGRLAPGRWRPLARSELSALRAVAGLTDSAQ